MYLKGGTVLELDLFIVPDYSQRGSVAGLGRALELFGVEGLGTDKRGDRPEWH